jgi:transcriptional regulator
MYINPAFRADRAASLAFAAARGFGLVAACGGGGRVVASPLPFLLDYLADGTPRLAFHVARANPLAALALRGGDWLVSVMGADAYVSPDWYASPEQVSTWLYRTVQLGGAVEAMAADALPDHLDSLARQFESRLAPKPSWTLGSVTPARRKMLMKAILGVTLRVETVEGSFKLNQHKSDADHIAVANALAARPDAAAQDLAAGMVAMRPHLTYENRAMSCAAPPAGVAAAPFPIAV